MKAKAKAVAIPTEKRLPGTGRNTHNPAANPGSALKLAARLREKKACELRLNGSSYREIGARLGITDMGSYKIIMRCLARELNDAPGELDHDEVISAKPVDLEEALALIVRGEMVDAKSIVALLRARDFLAGEK